MSTLIVDDQATSASPVGDAEGPVTDAPLIYFSSVSDNTHRFVTKLGVRAARMPLLTSVRTWCNEVAGFSSRRSAISLLVRDSCRHRRRIRSLSGELSARARAWTSSSVGMMPAYAKTAQ